MVNVAVMEEKDLNNEMIDTINNDLGPIMDKCIEDINKVLTKYDQSYPMEASFVLETGMMALINVLFKDYSLHFFIKAAGIESVKTLMGQGPLTKDQMEKLIKDQMRKPDYMG